MTGKRRFQFAAVALVSAGMAWLLSQSLADGQVFYALDDPYIHLSVAETILRGGYGINPGEFSSPSSSILYPFLLAGLLAVGFGTAGPLLLGAAASMATAWLLAGTFWTHLVNGDPRHSVTMACLPVLLLAVNAFALPLTGMEHSLHVLTVVMIVVGLIELQPGERVPRKLIFGIVLSPLLRFEGLGISFCALVALLWYMRLRTVLTLGIILAVAFGLYGALMTSLGLPILPSSVLVKSSVSTEALGGNLSNMAVDLWDHVTQSATLGAGRGLMLLAALSLIIASFAPRGDDKRIVVALVVAISIFAHALAGEYGWFSRYEIYAVAILMAALPFLAAPAFLGSHQHPLLRTLGLFFLLGTTSLGYA